MWILRNDEKGQIYGLKPGKLHVVSRKDGDLLLQGDQSISRKHAQLLVPDDAKIDGIVLKDLESKYGTFTAVGNGELNQLPAKEETILKHEDHVRFGIQWNRWRVEFVPLLVATSTLTQEEKTEVNGLVSVLGGQVVNEWHDKCTHLTMNKLTVTIKVVCALAAGQPIVTPAYWKLFSQTFSSVQTTLPDSRNFLPPLAEAVLDPSKVSFHPDPARAKLFSGTTFVAVTAKQMSRIKPMVQAAGGSVVVFSPMAWPEKKLLDEKTVLMQHSGSDRQSSQQSQLPDGYISLARKMKAQGVRCIPESEIGLSVLYCSLSRYCNPRFNPQSLVGSSSFLESTQPVSGASLNTEEASHFDSCSSTAAGASKTAVTPKRAKEESDSDEDHLNKKRKEDSKDVLSSQNIHFQNTENNPKLSLRSGKSLTLNKVTSPKSTSMAKENKPLLQDRSLDMFAPSGERSSKSVNVSVFNKSEVRPSCEDMFGSGSSRISNSKTAENNNESFFTSNPQGNKSKILFEDDDDEFSFPTRKRTNKPSLLNEDKDEFSFSANKRSRVLEHPTDEDDVFSFTSIRNVSNKRSGQSNSDILANGETCINISPVAGTSKLSNVRKIRERDEVDFRRPKQASTDDCFAFPEDSFPKRKRYKESLDCPNTPSSEVQIGLFSKKVVDTPSTSSLQTEVQLPEKMDVPEGEKNLVTYSKHMPTPPKVKKEIKDEEVDDLAAELHNATIVLIKPLVVFKPKADAIDVSTTVKNFKKFRKVIGVKKPTIPHIIGGCDLVAHIKDNIEVPGALRPLSPPKQTPDDDWTFLGDKKKGRGR